MSYDDSPPHSNTYDDYEYADERFDEEDEEQENEPHDDSDEDTEDASETDTGRHEEHMEIKEQMYQDKLASLKKKIQQLADGTHYEYNKKVKRLEAQCRERLQLNLIHRDYMINCIERDYMLEKKAAVKEFEEKKVDLKENLLSDFEDKKKTVEAEKYSMELTGDNMEVKPVMTRKLRRRPNDPVPVPEKRRKVAATQVVYSLDEKEIEADLKKLLQPAPRKPEISNCNINTLEMSPVSNSNNVSENNGTPVVDTRVEDGKLWYERRWFHRGQSVYVEGRDIPKYPASISGIANDAIYVKKGDSSRVKILISHLARGKVSIKRRAS